MQKVERQPSKWEKITAKEASDKWLISKIYKHSIPSPSIYVCLFPLSGSFIDSILQSHCAWLFCDLMHCSLPGSSAHGIAQARILKWVAIFFSRGSSWPKDRNCPSFLTGRFFTAEPPGKSTMGYYSNIKRNERVSFAETWMQLEVVIQSM